MRLGRDEFVVKYDAAKANEDQIALTIKELGYIPTIRTGAIADNAHRSGGPSEKLPPVITEALARAKREHKPVVLDFYAEWCVPCKRMLTETFAHSKVAPLLEACIVVKIDTDRYPELAKKFGVEGLPDIRFLADDGSERKRLLDYQDAASFAKALAELLSTSGNNGRR
jgi:thiol:disulfide interchange protein DsbD